MADIEAIRQWTEMLARAVDDLDHCPGPEAARIVLMTCALLEAAVTAYLVRKTIEACGGRVP